MTFQRIFIYILRSMTLKIGQMLLLAVGLLVTGHAVLTPLLMVIVVIMGDFLAMSATTDNVRPSAKSEHWHINQLALADFRAFDRLMHRKRGEPHSRKTRSADPPRDLTQ